jgi:Peptidase family M23
MIKFNSLALAGAAALMAAGAAHAAPIGSSFGSSAGTTFNATSLTGFQTMGDDMAGSKVTVFFTGGGSGTANWLATGAGAGSASTAGWSLALSGDSFSSSWTLTNIGGTSIVGFSFDGVPGNTVFDIVDTPANSPGSANGNGFGNADASGGVSFATAAYTNRLTIGGVFYDDLYTSMTVNFTGALASNGTFRFIADTDNASAATCGITPGIPEPETYALMLAWPRHGRLHRAPPPALKRAASHIAIQGHLGPFLFLRMDTNGSLNLDPDCANLPPPLAQQRFEAWLQLPQLGRHRSVGGEQRPAGLVDRPGLDVRGHGRWQAGADRREAVVRFLHQLPQASQRCTLLQRLFDAQCIGGDRRRSRRVLWVHRRECRAMQILITHGSLARTRVLRFNRWQLGAALFGLIVLLTLISGTVYNFVFLKAAREGWPVVSHLVRFVVRDEFAQRDRFMRENLDAMAQKVGEVQAKLIKLEAMGERVSGAVGVKPEELRVSPKAIVAAAPGGQGGPFVPIARGAVVGASLEQLNKAVGALDIEADQRTDVFTLLESRLLESRLASLMIPNSRPVDVAVGSGFGFRSDPFTGRPALHTGLDFPAEAGSEVRAAAGGVVLSSAFHPEYGNLVELDHGNGLITRYAHNVRVLVKAGDLVRRGQVISEVGTSGRSTGAHLHFEVLVDGVPQDPAKFLAGGDAALTAAAKPARARR